jgi:hypothetical protein
MVVESPAKAVKIQKWLGDSYHASGTLCDSRKYTKADGCTSFAMEGGVYVHDSLLPQ